MTPKFLRSVLLTAALAAPLAIPAALNAATPISQVVDATNKINFSGRQRMLTQLISKAACFANLGVEADLHAIMLEGAREVYATTLYVLENGDEDAGMLPETDEAVLAEIAKTREMWAEFRILTEAAIEDRAAMERLMEASVPMLVQSNEVVKAFVESRGSNGAVSAELARTVDLAGRQRMLSQRMSKAFCAIINDVAIEASKVELSTAISEFETALKALREGSDQIVAPPTEEIAAQLAKVQLIWDEMAAFFKQAAAGEPAQPRAIEHVALRNIDLLRQMNLAVGMY